MPRANLLAESGSKLDAPTLLGMLAALRGGDTSSLPLLRGMFGGGDSPAGPPLLRGRLGRGATPTPGDVGSPTLEIPGGFDPRITPRLLNLISRRESGGRDTATGKKGEKGRFQFMPATAKAYGISDPAALENPQVSQWLAQRYLSDLLKQEHGDLFKALEAYNAGPGRVARGTVPRSSVRYARDILAQEGRQPEMQPMDQLGLGGPISSGEPEFRRPQAETEPTMQIGNRRYDYGQLNAMAIGMLGGPDADVTNIPADFIEQMRFHGSKAGPLSELRPGRFYTATDKNLARDYRDLGQKGQLYRIFQRPGLKFLDMDKPLPEELVNDIIAKNPNLAQYRSLYRTRPAYAFEGGGFTPPPYGIDPELLDQVATAHGYGGLQVLPRGAPSGRGLKGVLGREVMPGAKQEKIYLQPNKDIRLKPTSKVENWLSAILGEGTAQAEEPPMPPPEIIAKARASGDLADVPPEIRLKAALAKPGPTATPPLGERVRGAALTGLDWLPAVGQAGGAIAGAAGGGGLGSFITGAEGAALGDVAGEGLRAGGRKLMGVPVDRSLADVAESGGESAVGQAAGDILFGAASNLVPGKWAARKAAGKFKAGTEELGKVWERTGKLLGMNRQAAEHAADRPEAARAFKNTLWRIRAQAKKLFSEEYENLLKYYYPWRTPDSIHAAYQAAQFDLDTLKQLDLPMAEDLPSKVKAAMLSTKPMTVEREQALVSDLKQIRRALKPDEHGDIKRALDGMVDAGERDIDYVLHRYGGPDKVRQYHDINTRYGEMLKQVSGRDYKAITGEANLPTMAQKFWGGQVSSQLSEALRYAETLPVAEREARFAALRKSFASSVWGAAEKEKTDFAKLAAMRNQIAVTPGRILERLYPGFDAKKGEWLSVLSKAEGTFKDIMVNRTERDAVEAAIEAKLARDPSLVSYLKHHAIFGLILLGSGYASGHLGISIGAGALAALYAGALHTPAGMRAFKAMAYGQGTAEVADAITKILTAAMTEEVKRGNVIARRSAGR